MQAVYWYAVLLLQPTLYLVSAPGPSHGELGEGEGTGPAENEQTHGNYRRPADSLPDPAGVGPGPGAAGVGREGSAGRGAGGADP